MEKIKWGIIGCGDVTEFKSGPAFNKIPHSSLIAVMRRDADKVKDYAQRHHVPKWYTDADQLINDPEINAVYIATPPSSHEAYALAVITARKYVYLEKPMALNYAASSNIVKAATTNNVKVVVAHYRRQQPYFKKLKRLIEDQSIGKIRHVQLEYYKAPLTSHELEDPKTAWRVNPRISGGGLFHDLAPHQLDIMYSLFGSVKGVSGISANQSNNYIADDFVTGNMLFENGVIFNGIWSFNAPHLAERDCCEIIGSNGKISFSFFDNKPIIVTTQDKTETFSFNLLQHVQLPMIEATVSYFLGLAPNPCSAEEGSEIMKLLEAFK